MAVDLGVERCYRPMAQNRCQGVLSELVRLARGSGCSILFGEEATLKGHDRTAEEDRLIASGKMMGQPSTLLSLEQYKARAARWYAAGADGLHLFNEDRKEVLNALGDVEKLTKSA